ncbi:MAG: response regulator [Planctomycetota bacterium]
MDIPRYLAEPRQVLVMDRDRELRNRLRTRIEDEGFMALEAESGRRAIDIARQRTLDVLVCDIEMPDISGIEVYRIIKLSSHFIPCILLGSRIDQRIRVSALAEDAFSLVPKPVSDDLFAEVFHRLLRRFFGQL